MSFNIALVYILAESNHGNQKQNQSQIHDRHQPKPTPVDSTIGQSGTSSYNGNSYRHSINASGKAGKFTFHKDATPATIMYFKSYITCVILS